VTRKTVEKHLGNACTKLGVTSLAALRPHFAVTTSRRDSLVVTEESDEHPH
jgi:DNA-binding NarL/FixJ family response regulator